MFGGSLRVKMSLSGHGKRALGERAMTWLGSDEVAGTSWPIVWLDLWRGVNITHGDTGELSRIADKLLVNAPPPDPSPVANALSTPRTTSRSNAPEDWSWSDGWARRWSESANNLAAAESLFSEAVAWLSEFNTALGGWSTVWRTLWGDRNNRIESADRLFSLALGWLDVIDPSHPRWYQIWLELWIESERTGGSHSELLSDRACDWLQSEGDVKDWRGVWLVVWEADLHRTVLRQIVEFGARKADFDSDGSDLIANSLLG